MSPKTASLWLGELSTISNRSTVRAAGDLEASEPPCSTHIPKWELKNPNSSVTMRGVETISSFEKDEVFSV